MSIVSEIERLQSAKADLATSIANKGVTVPANATLDDYPALVDSIQTGGGGSLPYDAEVEYLQGDGNQYIDTGFIPDNTCGMYIKVCSTGYNGKSQHILGSIGDVTNSRWNMNLVGINESLSNKFVVNWNDAFNTDFFNTPNVFDEIKNNYLNTRTAYVNDTQIRGTSDTLKSINRSAYIFSSHNSSGAANPLPGRIAFLKISKGTEIVKDYIPVRIGSVGYMYEKISGKFFGNIGTGSFTLGPDVNS